MIKKEHPDSGVVFIGPCAAKKLEAMRRTVRSDVDFVITFEELDAMFIARDIEFDDFKVGAVHSLLFTPISSSMVVRGTFFFISVERFCPIFSITSMEQQK